MARYPKFLKTNPTFWGLNLMDLGLVALGLFLARFVDNAYAAPAFCLSLIAAHKALSKYLDFTGMLHGLSWRLRNGSKINFNDLNKRNSHGL